MLRNRSLWSRKSARNSARRGSRNLSLEPLERRAMLSAGPFDPGFDPDGFCPAELFTAAREHAQDLSRFGHFAEHVRGITDSGDSAFVALEQFSATEVSASNHFTMTRFDFTFVYYTSFNNAPTADHGGPYTIVEGDPLTIDASASFDPDGDPLTYSWDLNGDGAFDDATGAAPTLDESQLEALGVNDNGVYSLALQVDDGFGGIAEAETTLTVENAAPKATIEDSPESSLEGTPISLSSIVTDPGAGDSHSYLWSVTKNDEAYQSGDAQAFEFTPDDDGAYEVTLAVTDDDGGEGVATSTIEVLNVAPEAAIAGSPQSSPEGTPVSLSPVVADPGAGDSHSYLWNVTKHDEAYQSSDAQAFEFTPDDNGAYQVTLTVTDDDGGVGVAASTIEVLNVAPRLDNVSVPELIDEGGTFTLSGDVVDPGARDTFELEIDWGDGSTETVSLSAGTTSLNEAHPYESGGIYPVSLTLTDDDQGATSAVETAVVTGVGVNDGVLQVIGSAEDDHAIVSELPDGRFVVSADFTQNPWQPRILDAAGVERVDVILGDGDDLGVITEDVQAPAWVDGGAGDDYLRGGSGPSVLMGGDGRDVLFGAGDHGLLIGGEGSDLLMGGRGNALIGGTTAFDANSEALLTVMAAWASDEDLSATVFDDDAFDPPIGDMARDWVFAASSGGDGIVTGDWLIDLG